MDELDLLAEELKEKYPRCKELIKNELVRIRESGRMGEFESFDLSETLNTFRSKIERAPCAQKSKRFGSSKRRPRRR